MGSFALDHRSNALTQHFAKAEENVKKSRTVNHAYADAQLFHKLADYSERQSKRVQMGLFDYDVTLFVTALANVVKRQNPQDSNGRSSPDGEDASASAENRTVVVDLAMLGDSVSHLCRMLPSVDFMAPPSEYDGEVIATAHQRRGPILKGNN